LNCQKLCMKRKFKWKAFIYKQSVDNLTFFAPGISFVSRANPVFLMQVMDNFIVSARKYRPQHFNTVVGQAHITSTLKNAIITRQLAQAYLFCGPRGVGKTTCARIFAKTINCTAVTDGEACDKCESCLSFNSGASLNVYELDAASNNSVDDIRGLVDQVRIAPQLGEYKVYIIDEVHMLSTAAFNAFLKTLEEPPHHAKFILATTEKHKIIPTILSRCQVFNFNRIRTEDISGHLAWLAKSEQVTCEPEALHVIAEKADGGLRDACSIFDQMVAFTGNHLTYKKVVENLNVLDHDYFFRITDALLGQRIPEVMLTFDEILRKGFDGHHFIIGLGEHLRNLLVSKDPQTVVLLETSASLRSRFVEQAGLCATPFLLRALALISKSDVSFRSARNQRLLVETTLMQIAFINQPAGEKKNDEPEVALALAPVIKAQPNGVPQAAAVIGGSPEPEPVKVATRPVVSIDKLKFKSSFSISEARSLSTVKVAEAPEVTIVAEARPVTLDEVKNFVSGYGASLQAKGSRQKAAIFTSANVELNENTITLTIQNEAQKEQFLAFRQEFVDDIRAALNSHSLAVGIRMAEVATEAKAYKPQDVFREMAQKNPALLELKKRFDLEIDY
jgi:DNA polymerase III subunit gamma/tau